MDLPRFFVRALPGLLLTLAVTVAAFLLDRLEVLVFGRDWLETLVLAILLGALVRSTLTFHAMFRPGVDFAAKQVLEAAIVLLGGTISLGAIQAAGPALVGGIACIVVLTIAAGYFIGRTLGLPRRLATLVACGNAICGNSAIAATAPVIKAEGDDVASSIAFTAVLGIAVVLILPVIGAALGMSQTRYGVLAGLTVYAVPQVLAATAPVGLVATQVGTLVKVVRVLMLGPVIFTLGMLPGNRESGAGLNKLVPWFIVGFLIMMTVRSAGLMPETLITPLTKTSGILTIISMAALGLTVDIRSLANAGLRVMSAAVMSLLVLATLAAILLNVLAIQ
ncbi:putative integral membrane protein (TIGR00698 family) [Breoghania corrubedonensis]|uniref:Putative integral membrane protein (TIGR00698 family) n=1 Tax=Breoghania corrubedonensis TaxID=665038 RepID=A0A2T5VI11_9HYPH|nr:putative sulfate exporter family transporter [Breoghania corrubedonensis]PTW63395.1 putative integral membrane protein (TIGR00698 family) [Breoghania corrubedonensis]